MKVFGKDLYQYTNEELADTLCYVPQTTYLFAGSIWDNLVYGLSDHFSKRELVGALEKACLYGGPGEQRKKTVRQISPAAANMMNLS